MITERKHIQRSLAQRAPQSLSLPISHRTFFNPVGIVSLSPGLRGTSYPGARVGNSSNPIGVASHLKFACRYNPFRVEVTGCGPPRVARASQPWADRYNPFGIEEVFDKLVGTRVAAHRFDMTTAKQTRYALQHL